jgi:O-antigen ligase like membrane protein
MKKRVLLIWVFILVDLLSGLLLILQFPFARIGLFIKGILILFLFAAYLIKIREKSYHSIYTSIAILVLFWLVGFFSSLISNPNFDPVESIVVLNRYLFFLIVACAFIDWSKKVSFENDCKKILDVFFTINNTLIFIGLIFKIKMFSTYDPYGEYGEGWRFGYKGLIWGQNGVAAIYTLGMGFFFRECFKYKNPKTILLITTCLAALFIGTKATWFTFILIGGYYLYVYKIKTLIIVILPVLMGFIYAFILYWSDIKEKYFNFIVHQYENNDFYSFWTSNRNSLLTTAINHVSYDWNYLNFIVGDAISYVEMDFFDLYFYFGISGIIYMLIYTKIFFIKDRSQSNKYFFLVWMAMAFVAGHLINSAVVPIFYLLYIYSATEEKEV